MQNPIFSLHIHLWTNFTSLFPQHSKTEPGMKFLYIVMICPSYRVPLEGKASHIHTFWN